MRSLLFLLLVLFSMLTNVESYDICHNLSNDVESPWHFETTNQGVDEDIQKFSR